MTEQGNLEQQNHLSGSEKILVEIESELKAKLHEGQYKKPEGAWWRFSPTTRFGIPTGDISNPYIQTLEYHDLIDPKGYAEEKARIAEGLPEARHSQLTKEQRVEQRLRDRIIAQEGTYHINEEAGVILFRYAGELHMAPDTDETRKQISEARIAKQEVDENAFSLNLMANEVPIVPDKEKSQSTHTEPIYKLAPAWRDIVNVRTPSIVEQKVHEPAKKMEMSEREELGVIYRAFTTVGFDEEDASINPLRVKTRVDTLNLEQPLNIADIRDTISSIELCLKKESENLQDLNLTHDQKAVVMAILKLQQRNNAANNPDGNFDIYKEVTYVLTHARF